MSDDRKYAFFITCVLLGLVLLPAVGDEGEIRSKDTLIVLIENGEDDNVTDTIIDAACAVATAEGDDPCLWKRFTRNEACITNEPQHHDPSQNPKYVRVLFNTTAYRKHKAELWYYASTNCEAPPEYRVALCSSDTHYSTLDCDPENGDEWFEFRGSEAITNICEMTMADHRVEATIDRIDNDFLYFRFDPLGTPILSCGIFIDSGEDEWDSTGARLAITNFHPRAADASIEVHTIPSGGDTITKFDIAITWHDPEDDEIVEKTLALYNPEGGKIEQCSVAGDAMECELHNVDYGNYRLVAFAKDELGAFQEMEQFIPIDIPIIDLKVLDVSDQEVSTIHPKSTVTFVVTSSNDPVPEANIEVRDAETKKIMTQGTTDAEGRFTWDSAAEAIIDMAYFVGDLEIVAFKSSYSTAITELKLVSKLTVTELPPSGCTGVRFKVRVIDEWGQGVIRSDHVAVKLYDGDQQIGATQTPDSFGYVELKLPSDFNKKSVNILAKAPQSGMYYEDSDSVTLEIAQKGIDLYVFPADTCLSASLYLHIASRCYPPGTYFDVILGDKLQGTCPGPTSLENGGSTIQQDPDPWCRLAINPKTTTGPQPVKLRLAGQNADETFECKNGNCKVNLGATCAGSHCTHSVGATQSTGISYSGAINIDIDADRTGNQICPGDALEFYVSVSQYNLVCSNGARNSGSFNSYGRISRCGDINYAGSNPVCDPHKSPIIDMGGKAELYLSTSKCMLCKDSSCTSVVSSPGVIAYLRATDGQTCDVWRRYGHAPGNDIDYRANTGKTYLGPRAPGVYTIYVDTATRVCDTQGNFVCPDCGGEGDRAWGCNQYSDGTLSGICKFGSCGTAKSADGWRIGQADLGFEVADPQITLTEAPPITELCPGATITFSYTVTCSSPEAVVYLDRIADDRKLGTCNAGTGKEYKKDATCSIRIPESTPFGQHKILIARDVDEDGSITCDPTTCAFDEERCECGEFYIKIQKPQIAIYDPPVDLDLNVCPAKGDPLYFRFTSQCTTELRKISLSHGDDHDDKVFQYDGASPECQITTGTCGEGATSCEGDCSFTPTESFGPDQMTQPKYELRLFNALDEHKGTRQMGIWRSADVVVSSATVTTAIPDGYDEWPHCSPVQKIRVVLTNVGDGIAYLKNGFDLYDYILNYDPRENQLYLGNGEPDPSWKSNFCTLSAEPLVSNTLRPGQNRILVYQVECNTWQFMQSSFNRGFTLKFKYVDLCECTSYDDDTHTRVLPGDAEQRYCKQVNRDAQGTFDIKEITISWLGAGSDCRLFKDDSSIEGYCSPDDGGLCMEPLASGPSPCFPGHCGPISECLYNECCTVSGGAANCGICEECEVVRHIADANGCEVGEDCTEHANDCGVCPITCDNGVCDPLTDGDCPQECQDNDVCDIIELGLDPLPRDCLAPIYVCGDHNCQYERGETTATCPADCCGLTDEQAGDQVVCANGICDYWESWQTALDDCKLPDICGVPDPLTGILVCDTIQGESCENCPSDCGVCESCDSDGVCEPARGEGPDCADCLDASCPDGVCQEDEKTGPNKCPADCYTPLPPVPEAQTSLADVTDVEGIVPDAEFVLDGISPPPVLGLRTNIDQVKKKYLKVINQLGSTVSVEVNVSTGVNTLASLMLSNLAPGESRILEFTVTSITDLQIKYAVFAGAQLIYYDSWITTSVETDVTIGEVTEDDLPDDEAKAQLVANLAFIVTCENDKCALNVDELTYTLEEGQTTMYRYYGIDNRLSYPLGLKVEVYDTDHALLKTLPDPPKDLGAETDNQYVFNVTSEGIATYYLKVRIAHCVAGECPTAPADLEAALENVGEVTVFVTAKLATGETIGVQEGESQGVFFQNTQMIQQAAIGKDYIEAVVSNTADSEMECAISFAYEKDDGTKISNDLDMSSIGGCHVEARTTKIVRIPVSGPVKGELIVESKNQVGDGTYANKVVNKIPITVGGFEATISDACFSDACFEDESSDACKQSKAECDRSKDVKANVITTGPGEIIDVPVFIKNPTDFKMPVSIQVINAAGKPLTISDGEYYNLTLQPRASKYVVLPVSGPTDFTVKITSTVCKGDPDLESGAECRDVVQNIPFKVNLKVGGYRIGTCRYNWECVTGNCITAVGRCCRSGWFWSPLRAMCVDDLPFFDPEGQPKSLALTVGAMHLYPVYIQNPYEGEISVTLTVSGSATTHITLDCGENVGVKTCTYKLAKGEQRVIQVPLIAGKVGTTSLVIEALATVPHEIRAEPLNVNLVVLSGSQGGSEIVTAPGAGVVETLALLTLAGAYLGRRWD